MQDVNSGYEVLSVRRCWESREKTVVRHLAKCKDEKKFLTEYQMLAGNTNM